MPNATSAHQLITLGQADERYLSWLNARSFGVKGDGVTDDTAAIQTAITANPGAEIYLPPGEYKTTGVININTDYTKIRGAGAGRTRIRMYTSTTADQFKFAPTVTDGTKLANCGIEGVYIYRYTDSTTGAGVHISQCTEFKLNDVKVLDYPEGIKVVGGTLNNLDGFQVYTTANLTGTPVSNSSLLSFTEAALDGGLYQQPYTTTVSNFKIAGIRNTDTRILIQACDGLSFVNGYVGNGYNANLRIKSQTAANSISGVAFTNVYFDGVVMSASGTIYGVDIPTDSLGTSFVYDVGFDNCYFANYQTAGFRVTEGFSFLSAQNCRFANIRGWAMDITGSNTISNFIANGCQFKDVGAVTASTGGISASTLANCTITSNQFHSMTATGSATGVLLSGTNLNGTVDGNLYSNVTTNFTNSATWTGNAIGFPVTFTPSLTFATPGDLSVAYTTQIGRYVRTGQQVHVTITIQTSTFTWATSSGDLQITGLPVAASSATAVWFGTMRFNGITKAGYTQFTPRIDTNGTLLNFSASGSGSGSSTIVAANVASGGTIIIGAEISYEAKI